MRGRSILAGALLWATLAGTTASAQQGERSSKVWVMGALTYREQLSLPLDSVAIVELHGAEPTAIATSRQVLSGGQPPIFFSVDASREDLIAGRYYSLHAAIEISGRTAWTTVSGPITFENDVVELGTLVLVTRPRPPSRTLSCGSRSATIRADEIAELTVGPRRWTLRPSDSAPGAKYESAGRPLASLGLDGHKATVLVDEQEWEECSVQPFRARGNEPSWFVELDENLHFEGGGRRFDAATPPVQGSADVARYLATTGARQIVVAVFERRCTDSMSGMPFPHAVEVMLDGQTYRGCGGEPRALLQGAEWVVSETTNGSLGPRSATLNFGPEGRVYGQGPCGPYQGNYLLTGEGLRFSIGPEALKSCEEKKDFFDVLQNVQRFEIGKDGALVLHTGDGRRINAQGRHVR